MRRLISGAKPGRAEVHVHLVARARAQPLDLRLAVHLAAVVAGEAVAQARGRRPLEGASSAAQAAASPGAAGTGAAVLRASAARRLASGHHGLWRRSWRASASTVAAPAAGLGSRPLAADAAGAGGSCAAGAAARRGAQRRGGRRRRWGQFAHEGHLDAPRPAVGGALAQPVGQHLAGQPQVRQRHAGTARLRAAGPHRGGHRMVGGPGAAAAATSWRWRPTSSLSTSARGQRAGLARAVLEDHRRRAVDAVLACRTPGCARCAAVSHLPMALGGATPSSIQSRQALALSLAHQMSLRLGGRVGPEDRVSGRCRSVTSLTGRRSRSKRLQ